MTDNIDTQDELALAAEYALGLLSVQESDAFEALMAVDPDLRDRYAVWVESFASLTDDIAPVAPPAVLQRRIEQAIFGVPAQKQSLFGRLGLLGPVFVGLAAAVVVLVGLNQSGILRDTGPTYVAELAAEDSSFIVFASFDPTARILDMQRTIGVAREGRGLEVWLIAGDNPPMSLGVWPIGQAQASLTVAEAHATQMAGGVLAITDEPLGGSPDGVPTGDVLAAGPVAIAL
jgi:anti-sigma-K factor RskA